MDIGFTEIFRHACNFINDFIYKQTPYLYQMKLYDIIIIGGGPIGLNCALEAKKAGLSYLIIEKGTIVNSLYHYPLYMTFFSTADKLEIANIPFITTSPKPGRRDALEYYQGISRL